jgi:hypothetical protein
MTGDALRHFDEAHVVVVVDRETVQLPAERKCADPGAHRCLLAVNSKQKSPRSIPTLPDRTICTTVGAAPRRPSADSPKSSGGGATGATARSSATTG